MTMPRDTFVLLLLTALIVVRPAEAGEAVERTQAFQQALAAAESAKDRDSKVKHLRAAVALRPSHPGNIKVEHRIVVLLSQVYDWVHGQQPRRAEALRVADGILRKYKHEHYYDPSDGLFAGPEARLMPQTAILAGCLSSMQRDHRKARGYLWQAMEYLEYSWARRKKDWLSAPPPRELPPGSPWADDMRRAKERGRREVWAKRKQRAERGDCLTSSELTLVKAAVRQYGYTFGPHKGQEVALPMLEIVRGFPGTPMARIAQEHIDRGTALTLADVLRVVPDNEVTDVIPVGTQPARAP